MHTHKQKYSQNEAQGKQFRLVKFNDQEAIHLSKLLPTLNLQYKDTVVFDQYFGLGPLSSSIDFSALYQYYYNLNKRCQYFSSIMQTRAWK